MDESRRKQLEALAGGGGIAAPSAPVPGGLPPEIEALIGSVPGTPAGVRSVGPRGVSVTPGASAGQAQATLRQKMLEQLASQKLKQESPASTETERASTRIAQTALGNIQRIREQLMVNRSKGTVGKTSDITPTITPPEFLGGRPLRNPAATSGAKQLRDDLENSFALLALLRTGKAGEVKQISNIRDTHNIGESEAGQPDTIIRRLDDMERELRGFASGELTSPLDAGSVPAPVSAKAQSLIDRYRGGNGR